VHDSETAFDEAVLDTSGAASGIEAWLTGIWGDDEPVGESGMRYPAVAPGLAQHLRSIADQSRIAELRRTMLWVTTLGLKHRGSSCPCLDSVSEDSDPPTTRDGQPRPPALVVMDLSQVAHHGLSVPTRVKSHLELYDVSEDVIVYNGSGPDIDYQEFLDKCRITETDLPDVATSHDAVHWNAIIGTHQVISRL